ncbi:MAG: hypothetical protein LW714_06060 [Oxalobacteraceae bacterium]|jgi:hypothetical protein|nr:hypothetical protein [Oxalobacteraceae bacterium]
MRPEIVKYEAGRYALLKINDHFYASVVCGSSAGYTLNIPITVEQADDVMNDDALLEQLVSEIAFAPKRYLAQHVNFDS